MKRKKVFFYFKIAGKDFIMGVDNLNFEQQPATSPEYEKLLFRKGMFEFAAEQNYQDPLRLGGAPRSMCLCENCKAFLRGARQTVLRVTESLQSHHSLIH